MRFNKLMAFATVALGLTACSGEEASQKPTVNNTNSNPTEQPKQGSNSMHGLLSRMAVAREFGQAVDLNTYGDGDEPAFAVVDFDSAGVHAQVYMQVGPAYELIMEKTSKKDNKYVLTALSIENEYKCAGYDKYSAYRARISYDHTPHAARGNDTPTNKTELEIYSQFAVDQALISAGTMQCNCKEGSEYIPSRAVIESNEVTARVPVHAAWPAAASIAGKNGTISIVRENKDLYSPYETNPSSTRYVLRITK